MYSPQNSQILSRNINSSFIGSPTYERQSQSQYNYASSQVYQVPQQQYERQSQYNYAPSQVYLVPQQQYVQQVVQVPVPQQQVIQVIDNQQDQAILREIQEITYENNQLARQLDAMYLQLNLTKTDERRYQQLMEQQQILRSDIEVEQRNKVFLKNDFFDQNIGGGSQQYNDDVRQLKNQIEMLQSRLESKLNQINDLEKTYAECEKKRISMLN